MLDQFLETKNEFDETKIEDSSKTKELKQIQASLCESLSEFPIANVSTLLHKEPNLKVPDELHEKVFEYREEQEKQILAKVSGDQT